MKYSGWTNYETWQAALWLSEAGYSSTDAFALEEEVRMLANADDLTGLLADVFQGWLCEVNFAEIASVLAED